MGDKVAIELRDGEKNELIETRPDGSERTYYRHVWGVEIFCLELRVSRGFRHRDSEDRTPPKMQTWVHGTAWLDSDDGLSIIGEPENRTRKLSVVFFPDDSVNLLEQRENDIQPVGSIAGRASLGFNRADWELGNSDDWWVQCDLHPDAMQPLIDAVLDGTAKKVTLGIRMGQLFSQEAPYMPRDSTMLYLRPSLYDNTVKIPEMAQGWLTGLRVDLGSLDVAPKQEREEPDEPVAPPVPPEDPLPPAIYSLGRRFDELRGTVKWVGGLIVVALLFIAFR